MKKLQQGFTLIELMIVISIVGILAAIAIPSYQDYSIRTKISEGLSLANSAKTGIIEYYNTQGKWPTDNAKAGVASPATILGTYVNSITVSVVASQGRIAIRYKDDFGIGTNQDIFLTATANAGSFTWACTKSSTLEARYLPAICR